MAFAYVCDRCLDGEHAFCEEGKGGGYGLGICVCPHYGVPTRFQEEVRINSEVSRRH